MLFFFDGNLTFKINSARERKKTLKLFPSLIFQITHARLTLVTMVARVWCSTLFTCVNVPEPTKELDAIVRKFPIITSFVNHSLRRKPELGRSVEVIKMCLGRGKLLLRARWCLLGTSTINSDS